MLKVLTGKGNLLSRFYSYVFRSSIIEDEELARRAYILNIILFFFLFLTSYSIIVFSYNFYFVNNHGKPFTLILPNVILLILSLFLLVLSKKGKARIAAGVLISLLLLAIINTSYTRGVNIPAAVVAYALVIFMSGILISGEAAIVTMVLVAVAMLYMFHIQDSGLVKINYNWKEYPVKVFDVIVLNLIYLIIALISWLSCREIKRSFQKAKVSEKKALLLADKLKDQNLNLEKIVENRTKELREHQLKQLMEVNSLAEFGKISAGLLHDIKSPNHHFNEFRQYRGLYKIQHK